MEESFYKAIINKSPTGYAYHRIVLNDEGNPCDFEFIEVNPEFEKIIGFKAIEIVGKRATEVLPGIKAAPFDWIATFGNVALHGGKAELEQYSEILNQWLRVKVFSPEKNYFITLLSDISKEIRQVSLVEEFFKISLDLMSISDANGNFIRINKEWESTLGYTNDEMESQNFLGFVHPDDLEETVKAIQALTEQKPILNFVNRFRHKDGSYRYMEWRSRPHGEYIYSAARDITDKVEESKCLERMISSSEEFLETSSHINYQRIADTVLSLSGAKYVAFSLYEKDGSSFTTVSISGAPEDIRRAGEVIGVNLVGKKWPREIISNKIIQGQILTEFKDLADLAGDILLKPLMYDVSEIFDVGQVVVAKIAQDHGMQGTFTIMMPRGKRFLHGGFISIYSRQVALLIDRILAEEALRGNESMLKEAQSIARLGRWELDHASGLISFSDGANEIFEPDVEAHQMDAKWFLGYVHPDDYRKVCDSDAFHQSTGQPYEMVFRIISPKGQLKWIHEIGQTHMDEQGKPIRTVGTVQDVTSLKEYEVKIERLLRENETIFNSTQDALFFVQVEKGPCFVYIKNNISHQEKTGIFLQQLRGKTPQELFGDEVGQAIHQNFVRCIREGKSIFYEETLHLPSGIRIWETTLTPVYENGQPLYIVGSSLDITERKASVERVLNDLKRNEIMVNILKRSIESEQEYLDYALNQAIELTESKYGYIYLYDEEERILRLNSWSIDVMEQCKVVEPQTAYKLELTGIWGETVRQRKAIVVNDFEAPNTLKKGYPEGHVKLTRFLSIPIFEDEKILGVVGVANKKKEYNDQDIFQLTILMRNAWVAVQRKRSEVLLKQEKELFKTTLLSIGDGILAVDHAGKVSLMNHVAQHLTGWRQEDAVGKDFNEIFAIIDDKTPEKCENPIQKVIQTGKMIDSSNHTMLLTKDGTRRPIADSAAPIIGENGNVTGVVMAFRDVTVEKQKIEVIEFMSYHDLLTGLFNRAFFEEELKRLNTKRNLPLTIVMADVNGLKLTNDAFGHAVGDKLLQLASDAMRNGCREDDIIARIGGDEFAILLPQTDGENAEKIVDRIRENCSKAGIGAVVLSISFGWESKVFIEEDIYDIQKKAEDRMYRRKLFESPMMRWKTIDAITQTLYETHKGEEKHSKRVRHLCELMGKQLSLGERELKELTNAGRLHDIGKIAIDRSILNTTELLNDEEWREIKRHPEIGYRILSSVSELSDVAQSVLAHHERWDGKGYPKMLKETQIPLNARIISLAVAYDVMTEGTYRPVLSKEKALEQIRLNAGTQFDPELAKMFINIFSK